MFAHTNDTPGDGSTNFRKQLTHLRDFIESFDFINMQPDFYIVYHSPGVQWQAISEPGKQYAIVFTGIECGDWVKLNLPKGKYQYEFVCPYTGEVAQQGAFKAKNGINPLEMPVVNELLALKIIR